MTNKQKDALVALVMRQVGNIVEFLGTPGYEIPELEGIEPDEIRKTLAGWMSRLPGRSWDNRLGQAPGAQ